MIRNIEHATKDKVMAALPALETMAQRLVDEEEVPGLSIAVVYRDEVVYLNGFGVREKGKGAAVDADTVFQLASLSKPLASTVVAAIVGGTPRAGIRASPTSTRHSSSTRPIRPRR